MAPIYTWYEKNSFLAIEEVRLEKKYPETMAQFSGIPN